MKNLFCFFLSFFLIGSENNGSNMIFAFVPPEQAGWESVSGQVQSQWVFYAGNGKLSYPAITASRSRIASIGFPK